jgi:antitoxin HicB
MKIEYPAQIIKEEDGIFFVSFPDIEEAMTQGETIEEAFFNGSHSHHGVPP